MTELLRKISIVIILLFSVILSVHADDSIFKNKKKARSEGPKLRTYCIGQTVYFGISFTEDPLPSDPIRFPCELYMGISWNNSEIQYSPVSSESYNSFGVRRYQAVAYFSAWIPPQECVDGKYSITFQTDLYCKDENGDFSSIVPCGNDTYDDILPNAAQDECSVAGDYTLIVDCCDSDTNVDPEPTSNTGLEQGGGPPPVPTVLRNSNNTEIFIYSLDGRLMHHSFSEDEVPSLIQRLPIDSGLFIVTTKKNGIIRTKKYFKNQF